MTVDPNPNRPRVVISGIGLRTGLGSTREVTWANLCAGQSAANWLRFDEHPELKGLAGFFADGDRPRLGPTELAVRSAREALDDARLWADLRRPEETSGLDRRRMATVIGLSKGDLGRAVRWHEAMIVNECPQLFCSSNVGMLTTWPNAAADRIARLLNLQGPCLAPIAACATGVVAVLRASALIRAGVCDVALAGAADASLEPLVLAAFRRMRALARVEDDPATAVKPWDRNRSGFLVGTGGAVLVLERLEHAQARGVRPYAEVTGGAIGSDAHHETDLNPDPTRLSLLIQEAVCRADVGFRSIDHINVHGTATRTNDPLECRAIRRVFGPQADALSCSANKAQIGHLLGGAGAAELAITALAIRDQFVPPTLNLTDPDPACDLDGTPLVGRHRSINAALKLSLGFGGHLGAVVLRRMVDNG